MNKIIFISLISSALLISCNNDDELDQLSTDVNSLSSQLTALQQSITSLSNATNTSDQSMSSTLLDLSNDIESIQNQLDTNTTAENVSNIEEQINVLSNHINVFLKNSKSNLTLNISGLEDLGNDYTYEGWLIVNGSPVSAGIFNVDGTGKLSQTKFVLNSFDVVNATTYVLTIEPNPDTDPSPSAVHILAGDFSGNSASINVGHGAALGNDFSTATGGYILATPTDLTADTNENSGVWWFDPAAGSTSLSLPALPGEGWKYEGWAVINGTPVTTGTFTSADGSDDSAPFSETAASGPNTPGEDFLLNPPKGLTFPTDLSGKTVFISIEPDPDNSRAPFTLKPLVGMVPEDAADRTLYSMGNNAVATNPTGSVTR